MNEVHGLLLCDDLIFASRITGTAKALGFSLRCVKTPAELLPLARQSPPRFVILDLHVPQLKIEDLVRELADLQPRPFLVGYGSHVDTATLKSAREAGCDLVWPRSKFVDELAAAMPRWFSSTETTP
jgi:DNA-binding NarL/FixJ family response regulator